MTERDEPRSFHTLRGFIQGEAPDEPVYFAYSATLRIHGDDLPFEEITERLQVQPTYTHRKGERRGPRSPEYRDDAWHFAPPVPETEPLDRHIDTLWSAVVRRQAPCGVPEVAEAAIQGRRVLRLSFKLRPCGNRGAARVPRAVHGAGSAVRRLDHHRVSGKSDRTTDSSPIARSNQSIGGGIDPLAQSVTLLPDQKPSIVPESSKA